MYKDFIFFIRDITLVVIKNYSLVNYKVQNNSYIVFKCYLVKIYVFII